MFFTLKLWETILSHQPNFCLRGGMNFFLHTLSGFTVKNTAMRVLLDNYKSLIGSCLFQKQLLRGALQTKSFANFGKILINVFESIHFSV